MLIEPTAHLPTTEVRFKEYGVESIDVVDNGCGISPGDYDAVGELVLGLNNLGMLNFIPL